MRCCAIVNPAAGSGRVRSLWPKARARLRAGGMAVDERWTRSEGHAADLAQDAAEQGYSHVLAVGGDGTLQEVVTGLVRARGASVGPAAGSAPSGPTVAWLPLGTGNDLARSLGLPVRPAAAVAAVTRAVARGDAVAIDAGLINRERIFLNVAGVGFDAQVALLVSRMRWKVRGAAPYVAAALRTLFSYAPQELTLTVDGRTERMKSLLTACGNGAFYGGGICICPGARLDDGLFSLCLVRDMSRWKVPYALTLAFGGRHRFLREVTECSASRVHIDGPPGVLVHADGQVVCRLPVEFSIIPRAVRIVAPGHQGIRGETEEGASDDPPRTLDVEGGSGAFREPRGVTH